MNDHSQNDHKNNKFVYPKLSQNKGILFSVFPRVHTENTFYKDIQPTREDTSEHNIDNILNME